MILEAGGEQADNARMPVVPGGHQDAGAASPEQFHVGLGARLGKHGLFHRLPFLVQPV